VSAVDVTDQTFQTEVIERSQREPVVVDFWADWCGPCKMMAPAFAEAARSRPDVRFVKVDTDRAQDVAARHSIRGIPTLMLFAQGREKARTSGAMSSTQLLGWLDAQLRGQGVQRNG
jgi:thioredoxin 2